MGCGSWTRDSEKLEALKQYEDDIKTAKDIINGKLTYCEECKDYYLTKSFFSEKETVPTKICVYEDPINSDVHRYYFDESEQMMADIRNFLNN